MDLFSKQIWEEITITGEFENVMSSSETLEATSTVAAEDKNGIDATATVLGAKTVNAQNITILTKAGTEAKSPYKITFKAITNSNNKWELDVAMHIKEI